jgi:hypothetical protein
MKMQKPERHKSGCTCNSNIFFYKFAFIISFHSLFSFAVTIAPSLSSVVKTSPATPHHSQYYSEGYVVFNEKGQFGKICTENLNATVPEPNREATLSTIATSLCSILSYE